MITTSNFAKSGKHPDAVAIGQGVPRVYRVKRYMPLASPDAVDQCLLEAR
jgi:hypothetical protein